MSACGHGYDIDRLRERTLEDFAEDARREVSGYHGYHGRQRECGGRRLRMLSGKK